MSVHEQCSRDSIRMTGLHRDRSKECAAPVQVIPVEKPGRGVIPARHGCYLWDFSKSAMKSTSFCTPSMGMAL
ncbi:MAG: hypothetical protein BWZ01_00898 [Deltaproteobacteria bacterium ADurb.BinA179]|nr:MAG: hypothetical protein BWZ01_00898 [Deltaproteobacteria bacterium ADurb.BinA179]